MCPGGLSRGGESQNEAKSRRFGMDLPPRAFYEGVNPKTILNNCHRRRYRGIRQLKSFTWQLPEGIVAPFGSVEPPARVPYATFGSLIPNRLVNDVPWKAF